MRHRLLAGPDMCAACAGPRPRRNASGAVGRGFPSAWWRVCAAACAYVIGMGLLPGKGVARIMRASEVIRWAVQEHPRSHSPFPCMCGGRNPAGPREAFTAAGCVRVRERFVVRKLPRGRADLDRRQRRKINCERQARGASRPGGVPDASFSKHTANFTGGASRTREQTRK